VHYGQLENREYMSPFLLTDELKMALRAEKFPELSRNGPVKSVLGCYVMFLGTYSV